MSALRGGTAREVARRISDVAWDMTVGAGRDTEEDEPNEDALAALARILGRPLTTEEHAVFCDAWRRHQQAASQP